MSILRWGTMSREQGTEGCARIEAMVAAWEDQGVLSPPDLEAIRTHCSACGPCSGRFSALMPLLERDSGAAASPGLPEAELADKVMARVRFSSPRPVPRLRWAAIAVACLIVAAGFGFTLARGWTATPADEVVVHFELEAPGAKSVALVGSFTDWDASKLMMSDADRDGVWQITVKLRKDSVAIYNFVIDGSRWIPDPRSSAQVDDGFGGQSSVLRL